MARVVVMGVTGCGKTTVGECLAEALDEPFVDGDDFHSVENIRKMAAGTPLRDEDRWPWLADVAGWLASQEAGVIACSALKRSYRDAIRDVVPDAVFIHLVAPKEVLGPRVDFRRGRDGSFAGSDLLDSQFSTLEPLDEDERGVAIDVAQASPTQASEASVQWLAEVGNGGG